MASSANGTSAPFNFFDLAGRTALVTGASSGLGREFALRLAKQGADVIVAARRTGKLASLVREIEALRQAPGSDPPPGRAAMLELDVSAHEDQIDRAVQRAWDAFGGIDILVNNAGVAEPVAGSQLAISEADWARTLDVNVKGAALVLKAVARRLVEAKRRGSIVMVSSIVGVERGVMPFAMYSASKAAVTQFAKAMALELGPHGIRVNALAPGVFPSEMSAPFLSRLHEDPQGVIPLGRLGVTDPDLTGPLLFLASDASAFVTGTHLIVDGGHSAAIRPLS